jgi:hypothetical protein
MEHHAVNLLVKTGNGVPGLQRLGRQGQRALPHLGGPGVGRMFSLG